MTLLAQEKMPLGSLHKGTLYHRLRTSKTTLFSSLIL